ncbi:MULTISPECIES: four helix bundle protein [Maribacter]|uniref:Four helix bundle protein n=1 Tax=Maribacter flavus TaxID=1658664 RepID=A0ABU7IJ75_9FLAO|nr:MULTISPECIES: four helix bundle protein [Maribacter]MDC6405509.1 four helix bundle protein [Maribacter sp. PR66]MEE1972723.1 four helix bundle protein [Maribacter flavus]
MKDLKIRTQNFSFECWELCKLIPKSREFDAWVRQLIRSSSSVGANYGAACRAKSDKDFINKLKIVEEELDESMFWLEMFQKTEINEKNNLNVLLKEANELLAITVSSIMAVRKRLNQIS